MTTLVKVVLFLPNWRPIILKKISVVVRAAGYEFAVAKSSEEFSSMLSGSTAADYLIIIDSNHQEELKKFEKLRSNFRSVVLHNGKPKYLIGFLENKSTFASIGLSEAKVDTRDFLILLRKAFAKNIFGIEKYLARDTRFTEFVVTDEKSRSLATSSVFNSVESLAGPADCVKYRQYANRAAEIVDELILNAVFESNPNLASKNTYEPFKISNEQSIKVKCGYDGETYGISVTDPFGSLSREKLIKCVNFDFHKEIGPGAGIKLAFDRIHRMIANVEPGVRTEFVCLFQFKSRMRLFVEEPKALQFYSTDESKDAS